MNRTDELKRAQRLVEQRRREVMSGSEPKPITTLAHAMSPLQVRIQESRSRRQQEAAERERQRDSRRVELGVACLDCCDTGDRRHADPLGDRGYGDFCACVIGQQKIAEYNAQRRRRLEAGFRARLDDGLAIPRRFRGLSIDSHPEQSTPALLQLRTWITEHDGQRGLFLTGPFGTGKTALMLSTLGALVIRRAEQDGWHKPPTAYGIFTTATNLLESLRPQDVADRTVTSNAQMLRLYRTLPLVAIDDLGSERLTQWGADRLFEVINHRHNELLPMLVTSNLNLRQLAERMNQQVGDAESGDRIVNRLLESCDVITLASGRNLRLRGAI